jgi:hypothetical protein
LSNRTNPEDDERLRHEHDSRAERFEHELAARERIAEHAGVPVEDPAVATFAERRTPTSPPALRVLDGERASGDPDVPAATAVLALSERTLLGMRREITARLAEIPLGGEESRRLGALSRVVRGELRRRAAEAGLWPRRAA